MICNCNNKTNGNALVKPKVMHVYGNVLRLAIPLTLRTIELVESVVDGETVQEAVATDTDFIPSSNYPVTVSFSKDAVKIALSATMDGNLAYVEDKGKIPVGTYDITITCRDDNSNPYRFNQSTVLQVVNATVEAGIETPVEYEVTTWYLDAAIYMALKGEDGVGIEDIITQSSGEVGGMNAITIVLTDGRTRTFTIMNGSGSVDTEFNINSGQPIANSSVTTRFNQIDESLQQVFGDVVYDSSSKSIQFFAKGAPREKANILASLDARPFIKDGMVNNVYISNNTLVITFNTDSGREAIGVPLTSIFNPNNYYNKTQVDNRIASAIAGVQIDTSGLMQKSVYTNPTGQSLPFGGVLKYNISAKTVLDYIEDIGGAHEEGGYGVIFGTSNGHIASYNSEGNIVDLGSSDGHAFLNSDDNLWYRYENNEWVQVGGSSSSGYDVSFNNGNVVFLGSSQPTFSNGNIIF